MGGPMLSFTSMSRLYFFLANTKVQIISANLVSKVKNALASAFSVPTFASVVA